MVDQFVVVERLDSGFGVGVVGEDEKLVIGFSFFGLVDGGVRDAVAVEILFDFEAIFFQIG
ncbi:hypothetical protein [uncultured Dubosiella sp.]|uniref:hypothetical protein n=1 Tax=uncultured Dubosiella sp. TaxID=1937011 RepID=UPI0025950DC8|nr:hypothetical protein [uncultured Dubosiella sp.]